MTIQHGLVGGSIIGLSACTLLLGSGNILGASGIAKSLIWSPTQVFKSEQWKLPFMASFFLTSIVCTKIDPQLISVAGNDSPMVSSLGLAVSGFLVGFGTTLGNGCTSGHGICGLARRSKRSFSAVLAFMSTGILSSSMLTPASFLWPYLRTSKTSYPTETSLAVGKTITVGLITITLLTSFDTTQTKGEGQVEKESKFRKYPAAILSATLFSVGLAISGMTESANVFGFLDVKGIMRGTWNPTLAFVMGGGLLVSMLGYEFVPGYSLLMKNRDSSSPLLQFISGTKFNVPQNKTIDLKLLIGAALFGLGWGIGGVCPGPAMFLAANGHPSVLYYWWPAFGIGSAAAAIISRSKMI